MTPAYKWRHMRADEVVQIHRHYRIEKRDWDPNTIGWEAAVHGWEAQSWLDGMKADVYLREHAWDSSKWALYAREDEDVPDFYEKRLTAEKQEKQDRRDKELDEVIQTIQLITMNSNLTSQSLRREQAEKLLKILRYECR